MIDNNDKDVARGIHGIVMIDNNDKDCYGVIEYATFVQVVDFNTRYMTHDIGVLCGSWLWETMWVVKIWSVCWIWIWCVDGFGLVWFGLVGIHTL